MTVRSWFQLFHRVVCNNITRWENKCKFGVIISYQFVVCIHGHVFCMYCSCSNKSQCNKLLIMMYYA